MNELDDGGRSDAGGGTARCADLGGSRELAPPFTTGSPPQKTAGSFPNRRIRFTFDHHLPHRLHKTAATAARYGPGGVAASRSVDGCRFLENWALRDSPGSHPPVLRPEYLPAGAAEKLDFVLEQLRDSLFGQTAIKFQSGNLNIGNRQLRRGESYAEKWDYVENNPVRHGYVARADEWPYQGEFNVLEWHD